MATNFEFEILTPGRKLLSTSVSEVVFHAFDGERGVLSNHENFIGLLGTGALKLVREKDDYWYLVSSGVYQVNEGVLTLFAMHAEAANEIDLAAAKARIAAFDDKTNDQAKIAENKRDLARLEVYKRTELVN